MTCPVGLSGDTLVISAKTRLIHNQKESQTMSQSLSFLHHSSGQLDRDTDKQLTVDQALEVMSKLGFIKKINEKKRSKLDFREARD